MNYENGSGGGGGGGGAAPGLPRLERGQDFTNHVRIDRPFMNLYTISTAGAYEPPQTSSSSRVKEWVSKCKFSPLTLFYSLCPIFYWLPRYNLRKNVAFDLIAGFTIAVLQIPQGMAYALLGNLPPIIGLYMAFIPVLIYSIMGTSRHVSVGTFAVICLMSGKVAFERLQEYHGDMQSITDDDDNTMNYTTGALIDSASNITSATSYDIVQISAALSLAVGIWQIIFGLLHTGSLSLLLSTELVSGFTTGAAFHVLTSQVRTLLGLRLPRRTGLFQIIMTYVDVCSYISSSNLAAIVMSGTTFAILCVYNEFLKPIISKKIKFPFPIELVCIIIGTITSRYWNFHEMYSVSIVHTIPTGLPLPSAPPLELLPSLIKDGLLIAIVAFAISISMAKIFSIKHGYEVDPNQELLAHGTSNAVGSLFSCAPISVSLSRSVIQDSIGGKSQLVGLFSAILILVVLLWIGPFFETLPNCVLSAIIIVALKGMFLQVYDLPKAWKLSKINGMIWLLTAISTVVLDVEFGLGVGLLLSVLSLIWRSNSSTVNVLGSYANVDIYADISNPNVKELPGVKIVKYTGSLNFVTIERFTNKLQKIVPFHCEKKGLSVVVEKFSRRCSIIDGVIVGDESEDRESRSSSNNDIKGIIGTSNPNLNNNEQIQYLILDMSSVSSIDPAALKSIQAIFFHYRAKLDIQMLFATLAPPVLTSFSDSSVLAELGSDKFFPSLHDAICFCGSSSK